MEQSMSETKVWGRTEVLMLAPALHVHRITFEAGGVCSEHIHRSRHNWFYVISGELLIRTWRCSELGKLDLTEQVLHAHEQMSVPSSIRHQFEALKSGVALEAYWPVSGNSSLSEDDIYRFTQGYMRN